MYNMQNITIIVTLYIGLGVYKTQPFLESTPGLEILNSKSSNAAHVENKKNSSFVWAARQVTLIWTFSKFGNRLWLER